MENVALEILDEMSHDTPAFKVRVFISDLNF